MGWFYTRLRTLTSVRYTMPLWCTQSPDADGLELIGPFLTQGDAFADFDAWLTAVSTGKP